MDIGEDTQVLKWVKHMMLRKCDKYTRGSSLRARQRYGWMEGIKKAFKDRCISVEEAREPVKDKCKPRGR